MTHDELKALIELLQKLETVDEYQQNNPEVICSAANLRGTLEAKIMVDDCKYLLQYMNSQLDTLDLDIEEITQDFYCKDITVGFGDMTVKIYNNADTFDAVQRLLKDFIADYERI